MLGEAMTFIIYMYLCYKERKREREMREGRRRGKERIKFYKVITQEYYIINKRIH